MTHRSSSRTTPTPWPSESTATLDRTASQGELAGTNGLATSLADHIYTPSRVDEQLAQAAATDSV